MGIVQRPLRCISLLQVAQRREDPLDSSCVILARLRWHTVTIHRFISFMP